MTMSRVTSQNRQSIAKSLRYIASCLPPVQSLEEFRSALEDELFTGPGHASYTEIFARLADLIDPTCKHVKAGNNIVCSECRADLHDYDLYCPHCGVRLVRDDL